MLADAVSRLPARLAALGWRVEVLRRRALDDHRPRTIVAAVAARRAAVRP